MDEEASKDLFDQALKVLHGNDRGKYIVPAGDLYPHQWLWDSCFIAIGLRHLDSDRAQTELKSLLRGQWANGMLPHIIFNPHPRHRREHRLWQSWLNPHAPNGVITSGLTQPPMLAEAVVRIGQKLKPSERRTWYGHMYPHLLAYHQWLYQDRSLNSGLIGLVHPYESGLDNSPPWVTVVRQRAWPWWLRVLEFSKLASLVNVVRRDTRHLPPGQRMNNVEAVAYWNLLRKLRAQTYDSQAIFKKPKLIVEDLAFNSIFIRANQRLGEIAKFIGKPLPADLVENMQQTEAGLEQLWDEASGQYYSYSFGDGGLIREPSIATLLPLYAGCISKERAAHLVSLMKKRSQFRANYPVPSVPIGSEFFDPHRYWQGPAWVNMNWLIIDGLKRYGFIDEAQDLRDRTLKMVAKSGCYEYFSPLDATPAGAANFSWTAALTIDLLKN